MDISVLLVSWNGLGDLKRCLDSLDKQTFKNFETILVDNGSSDKTVEYVKNEHSSVNLIALTENTGFAYANNLAAENAKSDLLFIVNTDTELPENIMQVLYETAYANNQYDIFSCQMINLFQKNKVDCKGMNYLPSLRASMIDIGKPVDPFEVSCEIFGATGGAMLVRKRVLDKIGLFDDLFFINNEDVDFALRAIGAGFKTLYIPQARVYHRRSPNEAKQPDKMLYYIQRNFELAAFKNVPASLWLKYGWLHLAYDAYQLFKWGKRGKGKIIIKAKLDALKMLGKIKRAPIDAKILEKWFNLNNSDK